MSLLLFICTRVDSSKQSLLTYSDPAFEAQDPGKIFEECR